MPSSNVISPGARLDTPESLLLAYRIETALRDHNAAASYALRLRNRFPEAAEVQRLHAKPSPRRKN